MEGKKINISSLYSQYIPITFCQIYKK